MSRIYTYCGLGSFAQQLQQQLGDQLAAATQRVANAVTAAVVVSATQSGDPWPFPDQHWNWNNPSKVSVFLPLEEDHWKRRYYGSLQWSIDGQWDNMLAS